MAWIKRVFLFPLWWFLPPLGQGPAIGYFWELAGIGFFLGLVGGMFLASTEKNLLIAAILYTGGAALNEINFYWLDLIRFQEKLQFNLTGVAQAVMWGVIPGLVFVAGLLHAWPK